MRRRIVALLQEYPEGLSPVQTRQLLSMAKDLGSTMKAMMRDGLLRRVGTGRYVVGQGNIDLQKMNWKMRAGLAEQTGVSLKERLPNTPKVGYSSEHQDTAQSRYR